MSGLGTLTKIEYQNLQQFIDSINRNFAVVQNSPLFKGIPGDDGDDGNIGPSGIRGSQIFFVNFVNFNLQFPTEVTLSSHIDTTFKVDSTDVAKPLTREEKFKIVSTFIWFSVTGVIPKNDKKYFPVYNKKQLQNLNIDLDSLYLMAFDLLDYMIIDTTEEDSEEIIERIVDTLHEYYALPMESSNYFIKIKNALISYL